MGRGDSDLLFNPPLIKRGDKKIVPSTLAFFGPGELFAPTETLLPDGQQGLSLQVDESKGEVVLRPFLGLSPDEQIMSANAGHGQALSLGRDSLLYSLTPEGLLWLRDQSLYFLSKYQDPEPAIYPLALEGDIFGLHAGKDQLTFLWREEGTEDIYLSEVASDTSGALVGRDHNTEAKKAVLEEKGEKSIVFLAPSSGSERPSLVTIHPEGFGQTYSLDAHTSHALWNSERSFSGDGQENPVVPAAVDGTYFYFDWEEGSLSFLDLPSQTNTVIAHDIDLTETGKIGQVFSLRSSGDRVLVLKEGNLSLYDKSGFCDEVALSQNYSKISFIGDQALLWNEGKREYLQLGIS